MTVSFKERFKTVLAHQRILFSSSPINFLAHQAQFFRDQPRKKRTKRGVELTDWTRDGHDKSLKYLLGANFRKNNTTVEKARRLFFFFFKNAKHVRIISKERRVRKFVESLEFFSPRVIHRSRRKWSSLLVESFYRSFPLDRLLSTDHHRPRKWKYSSCCSGKIDFIVTLHFAPLPFIYLFLGENGFLDT